jgi:hypothetical protein
VIAAQMRLTYRRYVADARQAVLGHWRSEMKGANTCWCVMLSCIVFASCSDNTAERKRRSLDRLGWSGGDQVLRDGRARLVAAINRATRESLAIPVITRVAFVGKNVEEKLGVISIDWVSSEPFADGLVFHMRNGDSVVCDFDNAYLAENETASRELVVFRAVIGNRTNPEIWQRLNLRAILTAQLTRNRIPIGQPCAFEISGSPERQQTRK